MHHMHYQFLNYIDAPKRILTLTIDEFAMAIIGMSLLVASNQKLVACILILGILGALRRLKKGSGPKSLLVLAYWYLPGSLTQLFLPKLPASHYRIWVS
jgi:conjugal transfer pilus assembly protein TraL